MTDHKHHNFLSILLVSCFILGIVLEVSAEIPQIGLANTVSSNNLWAPVAEIVAPDAAAFDFFGSTIDYQGDEVIVGAWGDDCASGSYCSAAYIFEEQNGQWNYVAKLTPSQRGSTEFTDVAINTAGHAAVSTEDVNGKGMVTIFQKVNNKWSETSILKPPSGESNSYGLAIDMDWQLLAVGNPSQERAFTYDRSFSQWDYEATLTDSQNPFGYFGNAVGASFNDNVIVGAMFADCEEQSTTFGSCGTAYVYDDVSTASPIMTRLDNPEPNFSANFGRSVALHGDFAIVGADGNNAAYIFQRDVNNGWEFVQKLTPTGGSSVGFGYSVDIDFRKAVVGTNGGNSVYVYEFDGSTWNQVTYITDASVPSYGAAVAIWGDKLFVGKSTASCASGDSCGTVDVIERSQVGINNVSLSQPIFPNPNDWREIQYPESAGTIDGNPVQINIDISNAGNPDKYYEFRLTNLDTGETINPHLFRSTDAAELDSPLTYWRVLTGAGMSGTISAVWDTTGYAWAVGSLDPGTPNSPREIQIEMIDTSNNQVVDMETFAIMVRPRPIILVHGFTADASAWLDQSRYLQNADIPFVYPIDTLNLGTNLVSNFQDGQTDNLYSAGDKLRLYTNDKRDRHNAWRVDLIGHSTGGLVMRAYIHRDIAQTFWDNPDVFQTIYIATPHRGSSCAHIQVDLPTQRWNQPIANQIKPNYVVDVFNKRVTNHKNVPALLVAGSDRIGGFFTCMDGPDGVVDTESAHAYGTPLSGSRIVRNGNHFDVKAVANFDAHYIREIKLGPDRARNLRFEQVQFAFDAPQSATPPGEMEEPVFVDTRQITLQPGESETVSVTVGQATEFGFTVVGDATDTAFINPDNLTVNSYAASDPVAQEIYRVFRETNPQQGEWSLTLYNPTNQEATVMVSAWVFGNALTINEQITRNSTGAQIEVAATYIGNPVTGAIVSVKVEAIEDANSAYTLTLSDDGQNGDATANDGIYTGTLTNLAAGDYVGSVTLSWNQQSLQKAISFYVEDPTQADYQIADGDINAFVNAINTANSSGQPTNIALADNGTYTFTTTSVAPNALPEITGTIEIIGNGATLQRAGNAPNMRLATVTSGELTLENLTATNFDVTSQHDGGVVLITGGKLIANDSTFSNNTANEGAALFAQGLNTEVEVNNSVFIGNTALNRGAIAVDKASVRITTSDITDNTGTGVYNVGTMQMIGARVLRNTGGGITVDYLDGNGSLDLVNSEVSYNVSPTDGAGIVAHGLVTIDNSTISNNAAGYDSNGNVVSTGVNGGGIDTGYQNVVIQNNSSITQNRATGWGGGLSTFRSVVISDSTISQNEAVSSGGGIHVANQSGVQIQNSQIIDNRVLAADNASGRGGGIAYYLSGVTISNSVVARNQVLYNNAPAGNGGGLSGGGDYTSVQTSCIIDNQAATGSGVYIDSTVTLDFTSNWWGMVDGPSEAGGGSGDGVVGNVDFSDYLMTAPAICPLGPDLNGDGYVTPADAAYVVNRLNGNDADALTADINSDGMVTDADLLIVMERLGKEE